MTPRGSSFRNGRRAFLRHTAAFTGALATPLQALAARLPDVTLGAARERDRGPGADYGALGPVKDETTGLPLLLLPQGFRYLTFGWTGDLLKDGTPTPPAHDGMAALAHGTNRTRIVRNHEVGLGPPAFAPHLAYDRRAGGGTTTLEFDTSRGQLVESWASLSGTAGVVAGTSKM